MKTVIILGAGATRAAQPSQTKRKLPPLDFDFFRIAREVDSGATIRVQQYLREFLGEYSNTIFNSLETATTYLYLKAIDSKKGDKHHKAFIRMLTLLNSVLAKTTNELKVGPASLIYRFLLSECSRLENSEDLTIITFNYDLLVERVLDEMQSYNHLHFLFPGCYRLGVITSSHVTKVHNETSFSSIGTGFDGVSVLKLHGSLNWLSKHTSNEPQPHQMLSISRDLFVANSINLKNSLVWKQNKRSVYMKPIIVPPISGKRGIMHSALPPIWRRAATALQSAERIVVVGYSCPPLDLEAQILLSENLRKNKRKNVYVIDPSATTASRFSEICGVDHITIYESLKAWIRDAKP